ncbi:heparan-alpha-glucosaminide N-acetyltransferase domain-containing protein [Simiduia agarivorans]|uniref:Heparan-alpha-glucosaminide N-acetyltransferase catalytic domain-containing protein n=1 Tax=Simiduia agarivorans (strain DSM 21679 / JCM 13881 / BCRC 17597 / SA1) TaxID=1117647 RepID=K4KHI7_SIMAS|nr:heparan-alpha-glucosaminide N-acetyltransferase domain-containing protein [Simiduia agarivorans]AFU98481.1 hypothetical protein M5M_06430 [Simiduia agarivorans SA1 = DSM 21679]
MNAQIQNRPPRADAVDMGRGLAVQLMVCVHTLWMYATQVVQSDAWLGHVVHFVGKGSAAFLICMGVSLVLSRKLSGTALLLRGLAILLLGFGLNAMKFVVPIWLGILPDSFIAAYGWQSPLSVDQYSYLLLTGDILQLAGCSLVVLALLAPWLQNKWLMLAIGLLVVACAKGLAGAQVGVAGVDYLLRLLFSDSWQVYFPVFPWISFIFFGLFLGLVFRQAAFDYRAVLQRLPWVGLPLIAVGGALCYWNFAYHFGDFFHLGPGGALYLLGINLMLLWLINAWEMRAGLGRLMALLRYCSQRVTSLYVIQWTLVCWGMGVVGFQTLSSAQTLIAMPVVLALTLLMQLGVDKVRALWADVRFSGKATVQTVS